MSKQYDNSAVELLWDVTEPENRKELFLKRCERDRDARVEVERLRDIIAGQLSGPGWPCIGHQTCPCAKCIQLHDEAMAIKARRAETDGVGEK